MLIAILFSTRRKLKTASGGGFSRNSARQETVKLTPLIFTEKVGSSISIVRPFISPAQMNCPEVRCAPTAKERPQQRGQKRHTHPVQLSSSNEPMIFVA